MSARATFWVYAANALIRLGRSVLDRRGHRWDIEWFDIEKHGPFTLASDDPLTGEQVKSACMAEPGLCFILLKGCLVRRYTVEHGWQKWDRGQWQTHSGAAPRTSFLYTLAPDHEETQKAPETPGDRQGQTLTTAYAIGAKRWPGAAKVVEEAAEVIQVVGKLMATYGDPNHWSGDLNQMLVEELADLTAAMSFFIEESRLDSNAIGARCAEKLRLFRAWHRGEAPGDRQCQTLPRKTKSLVEVGQHFDGGGVVEDAGGGLLRLRGGRTERYSSQCGWAPVVVRVFIELGAEHTLHPSDHLDKPKPEPEPKSGDELRRWMVAHPGRVVVLRNGVRVVWCPALAKFEYPGFTGEGMSVPCGLGIPETGTWDEEKTS